jgi:hypothetical protein
MHLLGDVTSTVQTGVRRAGVRQPVTTAGKRKSGPKGESSNSGSSNRGGDGELSSSPSPPPRRITGSIRGISMRQQLDLVRRNNKVAKVSALVLVSLRAFSTT